MQDPALLGLSPEQGGHRVFVKKIFLFNKQMNKLRFQQFKW